MALQSGSIPNLLNGVSRQPEVLRHPTQGREQINMISSPVNGLSHRPPLRFESKPETVAPGVDPILHFINRDSAEQYVLAIKADGTVNVWDMNALEWKTVNTPDGTGYLTHGSQTALEKLRIMTVGDYTFIVNKQKTVATESTLSTTGLYGHMVRVRQAAYSSVYQLRTVGASGTFAAYTTADSDITDIRTNVIAADLAADADANANYAAVIPNGASEFLLTREDSAAVQVRAEDSLGGAGLEVIGGSIQNFGSLPEKAFGHMIIEVTGDPGTKFDNFYVKATGQASGDFGPVTWLETVAPGIEYILDAATMPHILVRESDGTFTFKEATWSNRKVGDVTTNPWPSFVGRKIEDVFYYNNRLGFLANESVILSRSGNPFNFFAKTVTTTLDTDPIDVTVSTNKVAKLYHAVPHGGDLIVFSDRAQFKLSGSPLTPSSAGLQVIADYDCNIDCKPVSSGSSIFFTFDRGSDTGIREFMEDSESDGYVGDDITDYVSGYVGKGAIQLSHSKTESALFMRSSVFTDTVWVYSYKWADRVEGREKVQSSWSKWEFLWPITLIAPQDHRMVVVATPSSTSRFLINSLNLKPDVSIFGQDWFPRLDFWVRDDHSQVDVSFSGGDTTITLPYHWENGDASVSGDIVVMRRHPGSPAGEILTPTTIYPTGGAPPGFQQVVFEGQDLSSEELVIGIAYQSEYIFTMPSVREKGAEGASIPITEGELTLAFWAINYIDTGGFSVEVTTENGVKRTYTFEGPMITDPGRINKLRSGTLKFPVRGRSDGGLTIKIVVNNPYPANFVNAGWEGNFVIRSNRF